MMRGQHYAILRSAILLFAALVCMQTGVAAEPAARKSAAVTETAVLGAAVERQLPPDGQFTQWALEPEPADAHEDGDGTEPTGGESGQRADRVKVCRVEDLCKLRYTDGHVRRARIRNLVPPLPVSDDMNGVPQSFRENLARVVGTLGNKQGVVVRFVGFTDEGPLSGREERIYGSREALSKAMALRVAQSVQQAQVLPGIALETDGRGADQPLASNDTPAGRARNRRVEVEFWYDDPLHDLPDEPRLCPLVPDDEFVTRIHDPLAGPIEPIRFANGTPLVSDELLDHLRAAISEVDGKTNARVRFVGYTANRVLDRRVAIAYGDDVGLSTARAQRVKEFVRAALSLAPDQVEHEGRGFVQSPDVVNIGFIDSDTSQVEVQVVYDEPAVLAADDGLDITPLTREVVPADPFALNLMRITVDGRPVNDPAKSNEDLQRCTDVALDAADIRFSFDRLNLKPRLNVTAWPNAIRYRDDPDSEYPENLTRFRAYTNYPAFIERAEVRIFAAGQSVRDVPLVVLEVGADGTVEWQADFDTIEAPGRELTYVLRVYDRSGRFDETAAQRLWIIDRQSADIPGLDAERELQVGYGENRLALQNIPLSGGTVRVHGSGIPADHTVWFGGEPVPVGADGGFIAEKILDRGLHTVEVAVLDPAGNGELFLRDLELKKRDWFYVGIADVTIASSDTSGPAELLADDQQRYRDDFVIDGRLAGYVTGRFGNDWRLTASADTLEGPVEDLFSNFADKSPDALFRRIDPDYHYPTFGDDSTVEEGAPTLGKFYLKLQQRDNYGLWGNFNIGYLDNSLAHVDRGLYGANLHYESQATTSFGERRLFVDGFAAQPGTVASRDEFRGTGGSLYFLRHQDLLMGSERVRIEIRDKDSGIVVAVKNLVPMLDYTIDYLQGRIMLAEPLSATADDSLLVDSGAGLGNEVYLVARYEYTPGFTDIDTMANGGRVHYWFGDHVRLGITASHSKAGEDKSDLNGGDLLFRKSANSWLRIEGAKSEGPGDATLLSADGGFSFDGTGVVDLTGDSATAHRVEASIGFADIREGARGKVTLYQQQVEAGYSAPGLATLRDTDQYGGTLSMPLTGRLDIRAKADRRIQDEGLETTAGEVDVDYQVSDHWTVSAGARNEERKDNSPVVPLTQIEGERTDAVVRATYDSRDRWLAYAFVQDTVRTTGNQEDNARVGSGGAYRFTDRFRMTAEASTGDLGEAGRIGSDYLYSDRTTIYTNYALENERTDHGVRARSGNLISGFRSRYSDTTSMYVEERYSHGDVPTGLIHASGIDLAPTDRWNFGVNADYGKLRDQQTSADTKRRAIGVRVGYGFDALKVFSALEYRVDETEGPDLGISKRTTWLTRNNLRYQINPDWRLIGKLNHMESDSSLGEFFDGTWTEAVIGYGYRPVRHDRLNALVRYTWFYNVPTPGQVSTQNIAAEYIQKSHILSLDTLYDLTPRWSVGGKYAYRLGQLSMDRVNPQFFDSRAHLYVARVDWRFLAQWEALAEARLLDLPDAQDRRSGALVALYRKLGDHVKIGAGYNFSDFSDDLTDLDYDHQGVFINLIGTI
jgi:flagellar motor protein MotB